MAHLEMVHWNKLGYVKLFTLIQKNLKLLASQLIFICSKSTIETLEYVQS